MGGHPRGDARRALEKLQLDAARLGADLDQRGTIRSDEGLLDALRDGTAREPELEAVSRLLNKHIRIEIILFGLGGGGTTGLAASS